jgi:biotin carboxyl carrier protein
MKFEAQLDGETLPIEISGGQGRYQVILEGRTWDVDAQNVADGLWSVLVEGLSSAVDVTEQQGVFVVHVDGEIYEIQVEEETRYIIRTRGRAGAMAGQHLRAPMPGRVTHIEVEVGQAVKPGDGLIVLEAMKMENEFKASVAGTVKDIPVRVGQAVNPGDVLVVIE